MIMEPIMYFLYPEGSSCKPPHCNWLTYSDTLQHSCENIQHDYIDALIIAFGGDTFQDDPDASVLGKFSLNCDNYIKIGEIIKSYFKGIPILITQVAIIWIIFELLLLIL